MKINKINCLLAAALTVGSTAASAFDLYNNMNNVLTGGFEDTHSVIEQVGDSVNHSISSSFTINSTDCNPKCNLGSASLWLSTGADDPVSAANVLVTLFNDNGAGTEPDFLSTVASFNSPAGTIDNEGYNSIDFGVGAGIELLFGQTYWLNVSTASGTGVQWGETSNAAEQGGSVFYENPDRAAHFFFSQFIHASPSPFLYRVQADAAVSNVPVPGAVWLMATGLFGLVVRGRKVAAPLAS